MNLTNGVLAYVIGPIIVTLGTIFSARLASRGSQKAAEVTAKSGEETSAVSGYHQLVDDLRKDVNRLRADYDSLRVDHEEVRLHVRGLEEQATKDKSLIRYLLLYIRTLRDEIRNLGGKPPEAPADLEERIQAWPEN